MDQNQLKLIQLKEKIHNRSAVIGVVGLGYVGLPLAIEIAKIGFHVIGIETNSLKTEKINKGENYITSLKEESLKQVVEKGYLKAVSSFKKVEEMDVIIICVPTPLTKNMTPDLSYIEDVTKSIGSYLKPGQLVTLESTTYPGTTDEVIRPILEKISSLKQGEDFFIAYSPERVDPGNEKYTTKNTIKVVGSSDSNSLEAAIFFYKQVIESIFPVSNAKTAELVKIFENTFRAVNVGLVNELAMLCDRMGINVWEVLDAANSKPFGIMPFYPGPGVGGHCIPIDPHYLEWKAKEFNFNTHFIELAGEINRKMPEFVRQKAIRLLNNFGVASINGSVLIIGVAYKKDVSDWRESPAITLFNLLLEDKIQINYHDPYVPEIQLSGNSWSSVDLTDDVINRADLVIITTAHSNIDYVNLVQNAKAVLDTRGITRYLNLDSHNVTLM